MIDVCCRLKLLQQLLCVFFSGLLFQFKRAF